MNKINKKQMVIVLGMHRSGTSALTGVLTLLGAPMPQTPMVAHEINSKGFFESIAVMDVNNAILRAARQRWRDWFPLDLKTSDVEALTPRIAEIIAQEFGGADFVAVKDPRMCRLMPLWLPAIRNQGYEPLVVLPYRHPLEVAESLRARYNMPLCDGLLLWLRYVLDAEWQSRGLPRVFTAMPELLEDWHVCIDRIGAAIGADWPIRPDVVAADIDAFLDKDLKHQNLSLDLFETMPMMQGWISVTYAAMNGMCQADTPAWRARLDEVREAFDDASKLFVPSVKEKQGGIVKLYARVAELEAAPAGTGMDEAILSERLAAAEAVSSAEKARLVAERDEMSRLLAEAKENYRDLSESRREVLALSNAEINSLREALNAKEDEAVAALSEATGIKAMMTSAAQASETMRQKLQADLARLQNDKTNLTSQVAAAEEKAHLASAALEAQNARHQDVERHLNIYRQAGRLRLVRWAANPASRP